MTAATFTTDDVRNRMKNTPIFETMQYSLEHIAAGQATLRAPYRRALDGIFNSFHGGLLMTLADTAACVAVLSQAGPDAVVTTTDMNIRFLAPCLSDAVAKARVIKFGSTLCPVAIDLEDASGKAVAIAQVTYMRLQKIPSR